MFRHFIVLKFAGKSTSLSHPRGLNLLGNSDSEEDVESTPIGADNNGDNDQENAGAETAPMTFGKKEGKSRRFFSVEFLRYII